MFLLWLFGFVITLGLLIAYIRSKAKQKNTPIDKVNMFAEVEWNDTEDIMVIMVGSAIFCALWPISIPTVITYAIGKKIFK